MTIDELVQIVPPPPEPIDAGPGLEWAKAEREIGFRLPAYYKAFIEVYGLCQLNGYLTFQNPCSENENFNFEHMKYYGWAYNEMKKTFPEDYPRPPFPATGSFLTWAGTYSGDGIAWIIDGEPDGWEVVVISRDEGEIKLGYDTEGFLEALLTGRLNTDRFEDLLDPPLEFRSVGG